MAPIAAIGLRQMTTKVDRILSQGYKRMTLIFSVSDSASFSWTKRPAQSFTVTRNNLKTMGTPEMGSQAEVEEVLKQLGQHQ